MPRHLTDKERREPRPFLIDGQAVEDILGQRYYFVALDLTVTVVQVDRSRGSLRVHAPELGRAREVTFEMFERSVNAGFAVRQ